MSETTDGGVGHVLADLLPAQAARGWRVVLAAPPHNALDARLRAAGGATVPWSPGVRPGPGLPAALRALSRIIRTEQPALIHLHTSMAGLCGRLVVRGRRPTIFQPHSWSFFALEGAVRRAALRWERVAARWSTVVLCVSEDERRHAQRSGLQARFVVIPNGVDLGHFRPADGVARTRSRMHLGLDDAPLVVCVGRLHRQKGQSALLDAWPAVLEAVPSARLALVGDGPDRSALERRAGSRVRFAGRTDQVASWLAAADVVVQPSVWEGMSLSLLEAMAVGRSVVVTDVPGMREVVVAGSGAVVPPGSRSALAAAVVQRLRDPRLTAAEGAAGRRLVEERHDLTAQRAAVLELAQELAR